MKCCQSSNYITRAEGQHIGSCLRAMIFIYHDYISRATAASVHHREGTDCLAQARLDRLLGRRRERIDAKRRLYGNTWRLDSESARPALSIMDKPIRLVYAEARKRRFSPPGPIQAHLGPAPKRSNKLRGCRLALLTITTGRESFLTVNY